MIFGSAGGTEEISCVSSVEKEKMCNVVGDLYTVFKRTASLALHTFSDIFFPSIEVTYFAGQLGFVRQCHNSVSSVTSSSKTASSYPLSQWTRAPGDAMVL